MLIASSPKTGKKCGFQNWPFCPIMTQSGVMCCVYLAVKEAVVCDKGDKM